MFATRISQSRQRGFLASFIIAAVLSVAQLAPARAADQALTPELVSIITCPPVCIFPTLYTPTSGIWAITAEITGDPGRGFTIEVQNSTLVFTYYGYVSGSGRPARWYQAALPRSINTFTGDLMEYGGGVPLGTDWGCILFGCYAAEVGSVGTVTMTFTSATTGTITLPGGSALAISKVTW